MQRHARGMVTGVAAAAACGCSLGLDRSLLDRDATADTSPGGGDADNGLVTNETGVGEDAGAVPGPSGDDASQVVDAADATPVPIADSAIPPGGTVACVRDGDCPQDPTRCSATSCGPSGFCSAPTTYGFLASHFDVGAPAVARSSGAVPAYAEAIAAAYPFVFVVTPGDAANPSGVRAFDVTSPVSVAPRQVPIAPLPAGIVATVAVGPLVYFVGEVSGAATGAYQPLAWLDVTGAAGTASLQAHSAQLFVIPMAPQVPTNINSLFNALPAWPDGLFLIYYSSNESTYYPTAKTRRPMPSDTLIPYWNQALVTGADLAAASQSRLVAYTYDSQQPKLALVASAGTSGASVGPQTTAPTPSAMQAAFASNSAGSVLWTSAPLTGDAAGLSAARLTRLISDGSTSAFAASGAPNTFVDLEHYTGVPLSARVVAPPVWVDATRALGLAADHMDLQRTTVHVVTPSASPSLAPGMASLPIGPSNVGAAASNEFGYVLGAGTASSTVYVIAPLCP